MAPRTPRLVQPNAESTRHCNDRLDATLHPTAENDNADSSPVSQRDTTAWDITRPEIYFPSRRGTRKQFPLQGGGASLGGRRATQGVYSQRVVPFSSPIVFWWTRWVFDPTRLRTGLGGSRAGREPSVERIIAYRDDVPPSQMEDILATPHVVTGPSNYRRGRKNPQRHGNVLLAENTSLPTSPIFISTQWEMPSRQTVPVPAKRSDGVIAQQRVSASPQHNTAPWPESIKSAHHRPTPYSAGGVEVGRQTRRCHRARETSPCGTKQPSPSSFSSISSSCMVPYQL